MTGIFDRLLRNGLIRPFQQPERMLDFFNALREGARVTRKTLTEIADRVSVSGGEPI